jgi:hypothetical protein
MTSGGKERYYRYGCIILYYEQLVLQFNAIKRDFNFLLVALLLRFAIQ